MRGPALFSGLIDLQETEADRQQLVLFAHRPGTRKPESFTQPQHGFEPPNRAEVYAEVGDGVTGGRWRIVGVFAPPLLQQRSDTPCPMLPWSSCFNQGRLLTRSPRCYATERVPCWPKRSRPRWPNFSPSMSI